jgi:CubicO group peptidase (beta-lactamase class C family)
LRPRTAWIAALAVLAIGCGRADTALQVGAGFTARVLCSLVFDSGMEADRVFDDYVAHMLGPAYRLADFEVDREARAVEGRGLYRTARALHREGLGCTLVADRDPQRLRAAAVPRHRAREAPSSHAPWPNGRGGIGDVPARLAQQLAPALAEAFGEPEAASGGPRRQTTAVAVAWRGRLVAERYAPGISPTTPLLSWSMAKSVLATLVGIAIEEGRLALNAPAPVPEWQQEGDPRREVTVDQLLRMSSGLAFDEHYGAINDVSVMLFTRADAGAFAAGMPLAHPPDSVWSYSSGTSNILARLLRDHFGGDLASMVRWSRERLFDPIGMDSAFIETDASGSFVGSSFAFASARDWARFGQLHLQDGVWNGRRILPEGWVDYVRTPTPRAERGRYGAHWWLNAGDPDDPAVRDWPTLPRDVYAARGMSGQYVVVVPSADLVVVRLGLAQAEGDALHGIERLVGRVLAVVEAVDAEARRDDAT